MLLVRHKSKDEWEGTDWFLEAKYTASSLLGRIKNGSGFGHEWEKEEACNSCTHFYCIKIQPFLFRLSKGKRSDESTLLVQPAWQQVLARLKDACCRTSARHWGSSNPTIWWPDRPNAEWRNQNSIQTSTATTNIPYFLLSTSYHSVSLIFKTEACI